MTNNIINFFTGCPLPASQSVVEASTEAAGGATAGPNVVSTLARIVRRAERLGHIAPGDHSAFAVCALAVLGTRCELRLRAR